MPLSIGKKVLATGLLPLFAEAIDKTRRAAEIWANAYYLYTATGNIVPIPNRKDTLANDLEKAFNPYLNGGGKSLFLAALLKYWVGIQSTAPPGTVTLFVPSGTIETGITDPNAKPYDQAKALADIIHQLTVKSAKVWITPAGPFSPVT